MAEAKPFTARQEKVGNAVIKVMSRLTNPVYRATGGRIGGTFLKGAPVCLVTTIGRRSGEPRTVPLLYMRHGDDVVIVASKGGMPSNPAWYLNLLDHPECTIQIKKVTHRYDARVADSAEKADLWPELVAVYADFDDYQARTERDIPVIVCTPAT
jgi:deazaflavin-dependent oxidoreductase (nitroreductase family)